MSTFPCHALVIFTKTVSNQRLKRVSKCIRLWPACLNLNRGSARGCQHQKPHDGITGDGQPIFADFRLGIVGFYNFDKFGGRAGMKALFVDNTKRSVIHALRPTAQIKAIDVLSTGVQSSGDRISDRHIARFRQLDQHWQVCAVQNAAPGASTSHERQI